MADKELQVQEKQELQTDAENTRDVPVFIPPVDIYESDGELTLLADMPGVSPENVEIDLNNNQLTIKGAAAKHENGGRALLREYAVGDYFRQFTLSEAIDRGKIAASMKDGVLRVVLPKAEAAKPRKIDVQAA
jgi:HSP20 family protein